MTDSFKSKTPLMCLFGGCLLVAVMTSHASMSVDPPNRYLVARSMVRHGDTQIRKLDGEIRPPGVARGVDGNLYSHFNIGQALVFAPCYYALHRWVGIESDKTIRAIIALVLFPVNLALCVVAFYHLLTLFGASGRQSYLGAVLLMAATGIWQVHKECQESCHLILFYIVALIGLRRYELSGYVRYLLLSAVAMALAYLTRFDTAPEVAIYLGFAVWLVAGVERRRRPHQPFAGRVLVRLAAVAACMMPALIVSQGLCWMHFHRLLPPNDIELSLGVLFRLGLPGLLISPGRGLFWYNPILILAVLGLGSFWKSHRPWAVYGVGCFAGCLLLHAALPCFHGNCNWGPRYLYHTFPLLLVPALLYLFQARRLGRRIAVTLVVAASVMVQIMAVSLHHNRELADMAAVYGGWNARQWTMFEPEANFLKWRALNLADSIGRMANGTVPSWPDVPADRRTSGEAAGDAVLYYLAFWPYHLTYYLSVAKPAWAWPLWASTALLLGGIGVALAILACGYGRLRQSEGPRAVRPG